MEQLGCILLGFAFGAPAVLIIKGFITARGECCRPIPAIESRGRRGMAPLPRCDPHAAAAYFGSWPYGPGTNAGEALSIAELTAQLGGAARYGSRARVRFDSEGGYQFRL